MKPIHTHAFRLISLGTLSTLLLLNAPTAEAQCKVDVRGKHIIALKKPMANIKCIELNNRYIAGITQGTPRTFQALTCQEDQLKSQYSKVKNRYKEKQIARELRKLRATIARATFACNLVSNAHTVTPPTTIVKSPEQNQHTIASQITCFAKGTARECHHSYGPGWFNPSFCFDVPAFGAGTAATRNEAAKIAIKKCQHSGGDAECLIDTCF